jgi:two-component system sensor histidine kinase CreC
VTKRNRIFVGILIAYAVGVALMLWRLLDDIDPRYRESAEESLVETSHLLASMIEQQSSHGLIDLEGLERLFDDVHAREFKADIYGFIKTRVELRAMVVDKKGRVLFDSLGMHVGEDYSGWRDISLALQGKYGARTTRDIESDPATSVMYVATPIRVEGRTIGAVSVGKPVRSFGQFVEAARRKTIVVGVASMGAMLIFIVILSAWLVRPFGLVNDYVRYVRTERRLNIAHLARRGVDVLRTAFDEMRDTLAGRSYIADYVQSLTHELKSPLSAIHGAAELLQEPMEAEDRHRFVSNIQRETRRIQELVDRMLELSVLESRRSLQDPPLVDLKAVLEDLATSARATGAARGLKVEVSAPEGIQVPADPVLLPRAVGALLDNAVDFSPPAGTVGLTMKPAGDSVTITVRDEGPGIPDYAIGKVFEKFYSLERPQSGKKSSGVGLALARQIAKLHRGHVEVRNRSDRSGVVATLTLPARVTE